MVSWGVGSIFDYRIRTNVYFATKLCCEILVTLLMMKFIVFLLNALAIRGSLELFGKIPRLIFQHVIGYTLSILLLGGGLKYVLFSPLFGEMIQFD